MVIFNSYVNLPEGIPLGIAACCWNGLLVAPEMSEDFHVTQLVARSRRSLQPQPAHGNISVQNISN